MLGEIEAAARDKLREWIGQKGRVLFMWVDTCSSGAPGSPRLWMYHIIALTPGCLDPSLKFLRVWNTVHDEWLLSQDKAYNAAVLLEEMEAA